MTLQLGYAVSTLIFLGFFVIALGAQVVSRRYHPLYYWAVVVATTTVGTTTSDYFDRTLGLGYVKASAILLLLVLAVLAAWKRTTGRIAFDQITGRVDEIFYWVTILISNTLGTALGDFVASTTGIGFEWGALVFFGLIGIVGVAYRLAWAPINILFWAAYVLTRPLGATLGDILTKPHQDGGLEIGRIEASIALAGLMVVLIASTSLRVPGRVGTKEGA
jgi:uncharacterized membrane-anchored protein